MKTPTNSRRRLKEWELNPFLFSFWQRLFHFERYEYLFPVATPFLKIMGLYKRGLQHARNIRSHYLYLHFPNLPPNFDRFKILFLSDLHADRNQQTMKKLIDRLNKRHFDLVLLGGDYRFKLKGLYEKAMEALAPLKQAVTGTHGWFAVLGNHDPLDIVSPLESLGIRCLMNDNVEIRKKGQSIWLIGLDEEHYFENADFARASKNVPKDGFKMVLTHANDALLKMEPQSCDLFLCGHTHGGQICLPFIGPILVHSRLPRKMARGVWRFNGIVGFTTTGVGTSGLPLRFNCPAEFVTIELRAGSEQTQGHAD